MIFLTQQKKFTKPETLGLIIVLLIITTIQIIIVSKFPNFSVPLIIFLSLLAIIIIINKNYIKDTPTTLFIIFLIPLVYLNNFFHYDFRLELISSFPLILIVLLAFSTYLYYGENPQSVKLYTGVPLLLMVFYFIASGILNILEGKNILQVSYQIFQFLLYLLMFPLLYLMKEKRLYFITFYSLLVIVVISSIEYILYNVFIYGQRFVTFQSGFFPIATAILLSYLLYQKRTLNKFIALLLLTIVVTGTIVTLTRTLWFITFIVIILVPLFYLIANKKMTLVKFLFFLLIAIVPFLFIKDTGKNIQINKREMQSVEYRTKSVANPLEDASLLMRVELAFYAFERFLKSPVVGNGLGDYIKYKIFADTTLPQYYMDNTWLYLLWKGGIIGFLLFLWLYVRFIKATYFVLINSPDIRTKYICLGLLAGFLGLSFLGLLSPLLIKYKSNALIAFIFAYVEFERRKLLNPDPIKSSN